MRARLLLNGPRARLIGMPKGANAGIDPREAGQFAETTRYGACPHYSKYKAPARRLSDDLLVWFTARVGNVEP